eukprot:COSAG04_NODE_9582_length_850_cov_1.090546_2_plen_123_part_01
MVAELSAEDQAAFRAFEARDAAQPRAETSWGRRSLAHRVTMPESENPTYYFGVKTDYNDSQLTEWRCVAWTAAHYLILYCQTSVYSAVDCCRASLYATSTHPSLAVPHRPSEWLLLHCPVLY